MTRDETRPGWLARWCCLAIVALGLEPAGLMAAEPVVISRQPQSQTVVENNWVSFDVQATGGILSYAWYRNGTFLVSGTNQLVFPIATVADAGRFQVVLDNYGLFVTSQVAVLRIQAAAPDVTWLDRAFQRVAVEGAALPGASEHTFAGWGTAALSPLLTYRDGKLHFTAGTSAGTRGLFRWTPGALSTLVFTNTPHPAGGVFTDTSSPSEEGAGLVNFANGQGMYARGESGLVQVISNSTPAPGRAAGYLGAPASFGRRGSGVALHALVTDVAGGSTVGGGIYFHDGAALARIVDDTTDLPGALGGYAGRPSANAVNFDGTTIVFSTVAALVSGAPGGFYKATTSGGITKLADYTDNRPGGTLKFAGFSDIDVDGEYIFGVANNTVWRFMPDGTATNIAGGNFVSAAGPRTAYYGNTTFLRRWSDGVIQLVLQTGRIVDGKVVSQVLAADGQGDDVAVLIKFTDGSHGIYVAAGSVPERPVITREPADLAVVEKGTAVFSASAAGEPVLRYQWRRDGAELPVGTNASFEIPLASPLDQGGYSVVLHNDHGAVTSRTAVLTTVIPTRPVIWSQSSVTALYCGSNATFNVVATGLDPLLYQWFKRTGGNDAPIPGATGASLLLENLGPSDKATYYVVVRNPHGEATGPTATISGLLPWILTPPQPTFGLTGGSATMSVSVLGVPPITYQWFRYPVPITGLPDQTNATLTLNNLATEQSGPYAVRVTTPDGTLFTSTAQLTVSSSPPTAPALGAPSLVAGQFVFQLPTQAGYTYQVQSKLAFEELGWQVERNVLGDGTTKSVSVSADGPRKFFRVVILP